MCFFHEFFIAKKLDATTQWGSDPDVLFLLVFRDPKWKELIWQNVISELVMCIRMSGFGVQPTIFVFLHAQVDNYYKGTR